MNNYEEKDLQAIVDGEKTIDEIAKKYHTSQANIKRALARRGLNKKQKKYIIRSPYMTKIVYSIDEISQELHISMTGAKNCLRGLPPKDIRELEISVEVLEENGNNEESY